MRRELRRALDSASPDEAKELVRALVEKHSLTSADVFGGSACPWCRSSWFVKKGHDRDGGQRYQCCTCGRTFNAHTKGVPPRRQPVSDAPR